MIRELLYVLSAGIASNFELPRLTLRATDRGTGPRHGKRSRKQRGKYIPAKKR